MLASGIVLMVYLGSHLANHALGLISLGAAEEGRFWFLLFWRFPPVEILLLLAFILHFVLAFRALWRTRSWRLPPIELLQYGLGFAIPPLLIGHVLSTGGLHRLTGLDDSYLRVLGELWPENGWRQTALTLIAWLHGSIGIWRRLRLDRRARRHSPLLLAAALLLAVLGLLGFVAGGREVAALRLQAPAIIAEAARLQHWPSPEQMLRLVRDPGNLFVDLFFVALALTLGGIVLRHVFTTRRQGVRIDYGEGIAIRGLRGATLLEMSRRAGLAHAAVCGGRGRCSTCRVRILRGGHRLKPPDDLEQRVLERIGAGADIRLACQIRPLHSLKVVRLIAIPQAQERVMSAMDPSFGQEREIVAMFVDIRDFTRLSEQRLPFDTIFLLNRYFALMGEAIEHEGGHLDKFVGDGIVAFFGVDSGPEMASRAALRAARAMAERLVRLNEELVWERRAAESAAPGDDQLPGERIRIGIGLHVGPAILGEVGFGRARALTAIGDTVNVASRLEALNKEMGTQLAVSQEVLALAAVEADPASEREVDLRGRRGRLKVVAFADARDLPQPPAFPGPARRGRRLERLLRRWRGPSSETAP